MFRKISLFLTLVLVIGAIFGCAGSEQFVPGELVPGELTDEQIADIERAYVTSFSGLQWGEEKDAYYGKYEGYHFFLIARKGSRGGNSRLVANERFPSSYDTFNIYGYQNGEFITLYDLYEQDMVSLKTVKILAQIHTGEKKRPVLRTALKAEVEEAWFAPYLEKLDNYHWYWRDDESYGGCQYYGSCEGYAIFYHEGAGEAAVMSAITIGEYVFKNGNPFRLYAYRNGEMYILADLYEKGKISDQAIASIWEKHERRYD